MYINWKTCVLMGGFTILSVAAQEGDISSCPLPVKESSVSELASSLEQIILISREEDLRKSKFESATGLQVDRVHVPGGICGLQQRLKPYFGCPITKEKIREIIAAISKYYVDHYYPMVVIKVPKQDITDGVLQFIVIESRFGKLWIQNEQCKSKNILSKYIELCPGEEINERSILKSVDFINRNPFRRADIVYTPGLYPYTTDLLLYVEERPSFRLYSGADNTGIDSTGKERWYAGFNAGYLFGQDVQFAYQFTASTQIQRFWAQTAQCQILFPWRQILNLYGGYSSVKAKTGISGFKNHGHSYQASGRYTFPLNPTRYLRHEAVVGFDFKRTNNTILFSDDIFFFGKNVNLTQLVGRYIGNYEGRLYRIDFDLEGYWSPGRWISDQSNADFSSLRPGAKNHWFYARGALNWHQQIGKGWWLQSQIRAQAASASLLPSEQLGIGGYDTVRGYDEREINEDNGLILNMEVRSPPLPIFSSSKRKKDWKDALQFLGFIDYGVGRNHGSIPGLPKSESLIGIGPGARYTLDPYLALRADYGFKLHHSAHLSGSTVGKFHFSATLSY